MHFGQFQPILQHDFSKKFQSNPRNSKNEKSHEYSEKE